MYGLTPHPVCICKLHPVFSEQTLDQHLPDQNNEERREGRKEERIERMDGINKKNKLITLCYIVAKTEFYIYTRCLLQQKLLLIYLVILIASHVEVVNA